MTLNGVMAVILRYFAEFMLARPPLENHGYAHRADLLDILALGVEEGAQLHAVQVAAPGYADDRLTRH